MKRLLSIVLTIAFLLSNVGVPVYAHYCGKMLSGTSMSGGKTCACSKPGSKAMKDCCKEDVKLQKVEDSFLKSQQDFKGPALSLIFVRAFAHTFIYKNELPAQITIHKHIGPPDLPLERYLLYQNLRI